jgi:competence protein ComEC
MGKGTAWILWVAQTVAGWEGAVHVVQSPPVNVLPIMALGMLWVILWRGLVRFAGIVPVALAFGLWFGAERPPVLISSDGGLIGLVTEGGRALSAPKGSGFAARQWLENDGDTTDQAGAAVREGFFGAGKLRQFTYAGWRMAQLKGKGAVDLLGQACATADLVVLAAVNTGAAPKGCVVIDQDVLDKTGPLALWAHKDRGLWAVPTKTQHRLWTGGRPQTGFTLVLPPLVESAEMVP